ncbi:MAG: protein BatD [Candidatus Nitrohelix vancouverensis]|uniref:Protein BatD n=1 Tax=Candidatus Nitrohelix vancouverensis TaxID=2705534 RepID=A0A7T0C324_9BACT|nr:MAG: protein BatD [Candidatus Nitrohelix vancouverensis]
MRGKKHPWISISRQVLFALLLCISAAKTSPAADIHAVASVDKTTISLEDVLELKATLMGVQSAARPEMPRMPAFHVRPGGTASSTQIINGKVASSVSYHYHLIPKEKGSYTIPPIVFNVAGTRYLTKPIQIEVVDKIKVTNQSNADAFVEASVSKTDPYVGEQIVYTFKLFRKVDAQNLELETPYDQLYFRKESLGNSKKYEQVVNGVQYKVHELPIAYFPTQAGKTSIPPAILELDLLRSSAQGKFPGRSSFDSFFNDPFFRSQLRSEHKILRTSPIQLNVRPLPKKGKPANFSGLVGDFKMRVSLGKTTLNTGETTTLTVILSGTGNVGEATVGAPELPEHFKIYPDQPVLKADIRNSRLGGEKSFKFALVPLKPGRWDIPVPTFTFFDPARKLYMDLKAEPTSLTVMGVEAKEPLSQFDASAENRTNTGSRTSGDELFPIHTDLRDFSNQKFSGIDWALILAGFTFPLAGYFYRARRYQKTLHRQSHSAFYRSKEALALALSRIQQLKDQPSAKPKEIVRDLSQILREYAGNKFDLDSAAFTSEELSNLSLSDEEQLQIARSLGAMLKNFERLQFSPTAEINGPALINTALETLQEFEKVS